MKKLTLSLVVAAGLLLSATGLQAYSMSVGYGDGYYYPSDNGNYYSNEPYYNDYYDGGYGYGDGGYGYGPGLYFGGYGGGWGNGWGHGYGHGGGGWGGHGGGWGGHGGGGHHH